MPALYINFRHSTLSSAPPPWVNQSPAATWDQVGQKFADIDGTGVSLWVTAPFGGSLSAGGIVTGEYYGIPEQVWEHSAYTNAGSPSEIEIRGLPASTVVTVSVFAAVGNNRDLDVITNQGTFRLDHPSSLPPPAEPLPVPVMTDSSGTAAVQFSAVTINAAVAGLIIEWPDGAAVTLPTDLQPGASFTLNYSNYAAVPVSPVTITDSNNNSITVPVTINDNGDGTGTATGTMPSLPSSGTAQGLLFGNVTVELGT